MLREAVALAPNSALAWKQLGYIYHYAGLIDQAEAGFRRGRDLDPTPPQSYWMHGRMLSFISASRGERDRIDPRIFRYRPEEVVDGDLAEWIGAVYALLGEKQSAVAWLRRAVQVGNHNFPWFQRDKNWDKLRGDAEFQRIMLEVQGYWKHYNELFGHPQS